MPAISRQAMPGCLALMAAGMCRLASEIISIPRATGQWSRQSLSNASSVDDETISRTRAIDSKMSWYRRKTERGAIRTRGSRCFRYYSANDGVNYYGSSHLHDGRGFSLRQTARGRVQSTRTCRAHNRKTDPRPNPAAPRPAPLSRTGIAAARQAGGAPPRAASAVAMPHPAAWPRLYHGAACLRIKQRARLAEAAIARTAGRAQQPAAAPGQRPDPAHDRVHRHSAIPPTGRSLSGHCNTAGAFCAEL